MEQPAPSPPEPRRPLDRGFLTLLVVSVALYAAALTQPAFFWGAQAQTSGPAWRLLLQGWRGLPLYPEWLANPLLYLSWLAALRHHPGRSYVLAAASLGLMLIFLGRHSLPTPGTHLAQSVAAYGRGYWLWLGSAACMLAARARW